MIQLSTIIIDFCNMSLYYLTTAFGSTMITYEEMVKVKPQVKRPRPVMLVGESSLCYEMMKGISSPSEFCHRQLLEASLLTWRL